MPRSCWPTWWNCIVEGLCRPLHFFPQSSWLYLKEGMAKAAERWNGTDYSPSPAESSDPSLSLCFAGVDALDDEFTSLAARVLRPDEGDRRRKEERMKNLDLAHIETTGLHLIEASAGTGKTWTIAALYILLLLESRLRPEEILVVTYTKAATAELRDRVRSRISSTLDLYSSGRPPGDELERILVEAAADGQGYGRTSSSPGRSTPLMMPPSSPSTVSASGRCWKTPLRAVRCSIPR